MEIALTPGAEGERVVRPREPRRAEDGDRRQPQPEDHLGEAEEPRLTLRPGAQAAQPQAQTNPQDPKDPLREEQRLHQLPGGAQVAEEEAKPGQERQRRQYLQQRQGEAPLAGLDPESDGATAHQEQVEGVQDGYHGWRFGLCSPPAALEAQRTQRKQVGFHPIRVKTNLDYPSQAGCKLGSR
ncbi:MAG: hypothetical protein U5J82_01120 [Desulfobacterales bacterium]|nr:hypothetical protein [Desulfobacterales bacterium]